MSESTTILKYSNNNPAMVLPRYSIWHGCYEASWSGMITKGSFAHPAKFSRGLIERIYDHCLAQGYLKPGELALENIELHRSRLESMGRPLPVIWQGDSRQFHKKFLMVAGAITSPPYADSVHDGNGIDLTKLTGNPSGPNSQAGNQGYGQTDGQIGRLKVDGAITSPPFMDCNLTVDKKFMAQVEKDKRNGRLQPDIGSYGKSGGQIGNDKGETYWQAMRAVYGSCWRAIKPGGVLVVVVKDYVAKKQRVTLCDDTCRLLEHLGFTVVERIQAMLVCRSVHSDLFEGEMTVKKERKSFFRRLAEKKGSPSIDFEEVIICRRAGGGNGETE